MKNNRLLVAGVLIASCSAAIADEANPSLGEKIRFPQKSESGEKPSVSEALAAHGIKYNGLLIGAAFNNLSTGVDTGKTGAQMMFINAVDLDLGVIAGIDNAKIHMEATLFPYKYPAESMDNYENYASSYLGGDQYPAHDTGAPVFSLLTYEQTLLDGAFNFELGKLNLQRYFFRPNSGIDFVYTDPLVKWDAGVPDASTGTLGLRLRYRLTPRLNLEAGGQEMRDYAKLVAKNGWDAFSTGGQDGTFWVGSLGYRSDASNRYPSDIELTYYKADAEISDPYHSVNGTSVVLTGDDAKTHQGSDGVVFKFNQGVWADSTANIFEASRLSVFGAVEKSFDDAKPINLGLTAGLVWSNPLGFQPDQFNIDQAVFKIHYVNINESTLLAQRDLRISNGGGSEMTDENQYRFELSTTLGVAKHLKVQPVVEYILNPDTSKSRTTADMPSSGWLTGVMMIVPFGN
ncbi:carbohydrate porin [Oceanobacter mangrovi]|uniref:carbohydrate porin n=1 Tax=Oceanobacter mangrovi TaxID=2862510 RepID=UPI001C8EC115|nr:carbohydrate porin [Oceanobacter mangrovi]